MKAKDIINESIKKLHEEDDDELECTCPDTCISGCKGKCGCEMHKEAWNDFLSLEP